MRILNFGSLNLDYTYRVPHIAAPGETITSDELDIHPGGKGLNQSVALAKAGADVFHAGQVGEDGRMLREICEQSGVDTRFMKTSQIRSGNAIIQVDQDGQNCIVLFPGANRAIGKTFIDEVLAEFGEGDYLLLQNEISNLEYIIDQAWERKIRIILNPSPMDERLLKCDLRKVFLFILNEVEGAQITGKTDSKEIISEMNRRFPETEIVLTLGKDGSMYSDGENTVFQPIFRTAVKDTTGAGDTFTGYFITEYLNGKSAQEALESASLAASIAVSREGAANAVPYMEEVRRRKEELQKAVSESNFGF